jgi:hypothetical protein
MLMPGSKGRRLCPDRLHTAHRTGNTEFQEQHFGEQSGEFCFRCQFQTSRAPEKVCAWSIPSLPQVLVPGETFLVEASMSLLSDMPAVTISFSAVSPLYL